MPHSEPLLVLIHSQLVGPLTWLPVADELRRRGTEAMVPVLHDAEDAGLPYWRQHAESVARALAPLPADRPLILAGHSGAGMLLPAVRELSGRPVAGYIFVDAGIPEDGKSRLELMEAEVPEFAAEFRRALEAGARYPTWRDEDLRELIPEAALRQSLLEDLRPRALPFFAEPIPVFAGWPDAPCAFLKFSPAYDVDAAQALRLRWAYRELDAGHFHMLVEPGEVADALLGLAAQMKREA